MNRLLLLQNRVAALEQRFAQTGRHGAVAEVNTEEGWVRLNLGEGDTGPLLSPKIPYAQMAGALKVHTPPSVGQNMTLFSPSGDPRQAIAVPMTWSGDNPTPGNGADPVLTYGSVKITIEGGALVIDIDGTVWRLSAEGYRQTGGGMSNNDLDVGSTHTHPGILPGDASTEPPNPGGP